MAVLAYDSIDGSNIFDTLVYECGITEHNAKLAITDIIANVICNHIYPLNICSWEIRLLPHTYMEIQITLNVDITSDMLDKVVSFTEELEAIGFEVNKLQWIQKGLSAPLQNPKK